MRVDDAATARPPPPAWSVGVAAMVMGATMWIFGARFFGTFWKRIRGVLVMTYLCSWTRPNVSKAALAGVRRGAVSEAQCSSTSRIGRRGARRARAAVRTAWRLPARRRVRDGGPEAQSAASASRRSLSSSVDAACSARSVFRGGGVRRVVATGGGGGSARAIVVAAPSAACRPPFSASRSTDHGSSSGAGRWRGGRRRGALRRVVHQVRVI